MTWRCKSSGGLGDRNSRPNGKVNQATVSKIESESDMYASTLRRFLEAMGASLKIVAVFPEGEIPIIQFGKLRQDDGKRAPA